jgi:hypothetical protein
MVGMEKSIEEDDARHEKFSAVKFCDGVAYGFDLLIGELRRGGQP